MLKNSMTSHVIGMCETRRRKNLSLLQIGCSICTTGIPDLLAAKGLREIRNVFDIILSANFSECLLDCGRTLFRLSVV